MATYNVMQTIGNVTIQQIQQYIKYKIERIHIHKLKHTYAKFTGNLHWCIKTLFVKLALKPLID